MDHKEDHSYNTRATWNNNIVGNLHSRPYLCPFLQRCNIVLLYYLYLSPTHVPSLGVIEWNRTPTNNVSNPTLGHSRNPKPCYVLVSCLELRVLS
jgi:hypothetical protein